MHVIGTAGHVDHGKSSLVRALTGIDPDRLAEEKAREMTIDLGFAWLRLGDDDVGIVDVPGHRDFIENMLAGVGGIDLAILVVAADEGVMPQTREHLAILDLLGVTRGLVALTKIDLVDDSDWLELVTLEIGEVLAGTTFANAPILPVSTRTGTGLDELKATLQTMLQQTPARPDLGRPRLPIDRVFSLSGFGTIVTGTLVDGVFRVGDPVEIQPGGLNGRIRGLQTHKTKRETALPGSRVAINLTGIDRSDLNRGQVVTAPGLLRPTTLVDAVYRHLPDAGYSLEHNAQMKLFVGSAEVVARVRLIGAEELPPGAEGWIQLALGSPLAVARGDRFILRRPSPGETTGGGRILDPHPGRRHRRFRPENVERFVTLAKGSPAEILIQTLVRLGPSTVEELSARSGLEIDVARPALEQLLAEQTVISIGRQFVAGAWWNQVRRRAVEFVMAYHHDNPLRAGLSREELRSRLQLSSPVFNALMSRMTESGELAEDGAAVRLPDHEIRFTAEEQAAIAALERTLALQGVNSPSVKECKAQVGEAVYYALIDLGRLKPVSGEVVYSAAEYDNLTAAIVAYIQRNGSINAAQARDLLGASRKYAIALLEHLDERRLTRRVGDVRELV